METGDKRARPEERDDLQSPLVHEGAPTEHHDGNEDADDLVEVVEPDGDTTPRVANRGGRSVESDDTPPERSAGDAEPA
jgi:hypothetical protein